jgi:isopenicillin N synthase-like dioxygenase
MPRSIPVLNLSDYSHGTPQERDTFAKAWRDGLLQFGFVSITNHGVDSSAIAAAYRDAARFFALPVETKKKYDYPGGGGQRGYTGFGKEHAKNRSVGDLKEFWHVGRDPSETEALANPASVNRWPQEVDTFQHSTQALFHALDAAAAVLLRALADGFGFPTQTFSAMAENGSSILRIIHYPPLNDMFIPNGVRAAEHEDINLITLLCESTAAGLEILTRENEWMPVEAPKGHIVVDSGDMLSRCTNQVIPSTTHRVVNPPSSAFDTPRYSMPFFVHPYPQCSLQVMDAFITPDRPKHAPDITAGDFLKQRLLEIGLLK